MDMDMDEDALRPPLVLHVSAQEDFCSDTVAGWLWYCDVHDAHGNADSRAEAKHVAHAHRLFHAEAADDDDDEGCDIVVWMRTEHERRG
jgi:hypothetical protein